MRSVATISRRPSTRYTSRTLPRAWRSMRERSVSRMTGLAADFTVRPGLDRGSKPNDNAPGAIVNGSRVSCVRYCFAGALTSGAGRESDFGASTFGSILGAGIDAGADSRRGSGAVGRDSGGADTLGAGAGAGVGGGGV